MFGQITPLHKNSNLRSSSGSVVSSLGSPEKNFTPSPSSDSPISHLLYPSLKVLKTEYLLSSVYSQPRNPKDAQKYNKKISDDIFKIFTAFEPIDNLSNDDFFNHFLITLADFLQYSKDALVEPHFLKEILNKNFETIKNRLKLSDHQKELNLSQLIQDVLNTFEEDSFAILSEEENPFDDKVSHFKTHIKESDFIGFFIESYNFFKTPNNSNFDVLESFTIFLQVLEKSLNPNFNLVLSHNTKIKINNPMVESNKFKKFEKLIKDTLKIEDFNLRNYITDIIKRYNELISTNTHTINPFLDTSFDNSGIDEYNQTTTHSTSVNFENGQQDSTAHQSVIETPLDTVLDNSSIDENNQTTPLTSVNFEYGFVSQQTNNENQGALETRLNDSEYSILLPISLQNDVSRVEVPTMIDPLINNQQFYHSPIYHSSQDNDLEDNLEPFDGPFEFTTEFFDENLSITDNIALDPLTATFPGALATTIGPDNVALEPSTATATDDLNTIHDDPIKFHYIRSCLRSSRVSTPLLILLGTVSMMTLYVYRHEIGAMSGSILRTNSDDTILFIAQPPESLEDSTEDELSLNPTQSMFPSCPAIDSNTFELCYFFPRFNNGPYPHPHHVFNGLLHWLGLNTNSHFESHSSITPFEPGQLDKALVAIDIANQEVKWYQFLRSFFQNIGHRLGKVAGAISESFYDPYNPNFDSFKVFG